MMALYGAARRSRVRRIVLLAHTFGYAVLLGVVACVVDAGVLRGFLVAALMLSSVASGAWSFVLLFLWDGLGLVLRFFMRGRGS